MKYQILYKTPNGIRLCDIPTRGNCAWVFTYTQEQAEQRVCDLQAVGIDAWYEPIQNCWADNKNWIG
jgi:hypothetical protein